MSEVEQVDILPHECTVEGNFHAVITDEFANSMVASRFQVSQVHRMLSPSFEVS